MTEDQYIGTRLRMRRRIMGLSQSELGAFEGLTFQQIQKYERGINRISSGRLYRFAKILKVYVNYFYEGMERALEKNEKNELEKNAKEIQKEKEIVRLNEHFLKIKEDSLRKSIIDLVRSFAQK